jgi:proline iminopeptidase
MTSPGDRIGPYPSIMPYRSSTLHVGGVHDIYFEECGTPAGRPVVMLHGGPGGGCTDTMRRYHDPDRYRIILFDQRGCGRSSPAGCLEQNTTWHLVDDMERLRKHLGIDRWQVFGGSWGSTLGLAYAETHPERVLELILRGIFTVREAELRWFYQEGASWLFPDRFAAYQAPIPLAERSDMIAAYHRRLTGDDEDARIKAALAWSAWEGSTLSLQSHADMADKFSQIEYALNFARIECHYFINKGFFEHDGQLLANAGRLAQIPGVLVQGRYDVITPAATAWELHQSWQEARLHIVPDAGHAMTEPGIIDALVRATRSFIT